MYIAVMIVSVANIAAAISVDLKYTPKGTKGVCNSYVPGDSTFNRFIFVVQFLARNGMYVMLDNQINFDTTAITNPSAWLQVFLITYFRDSRLSPCLVPCIGMM